MLSELDIESQRFQVARYRWIGSLATLLCWILWVLFVFVAGGRSIFIPGFPQLVIKLSNIYLISGLLTVAAGYEVYKFVRGVLEVRHGYVDMLDSEIVVANWHREKVSMQWQSIREMHLSYWWRFSPIKIELIADSGHVFINPLIESQGELLGEIIERANLEKRSESRIRDVYVRKS